MLTGAARLLAASEAGKAGPLGLLVIIMLGVAVYFLYRSMVRHMNKVPASFDTDPAEPTMPADRQPPTDGQPTDSQAPNADPARRSRDGGTDGRGG